MKVKAYIGLEVEVEIDNKFKVLDASINETPNCDKDLYLECLSEVAKSAKVALVEHIDPIYFNQKCKVYGVEAIETGNMMTEK